ncbi:aspartyl-phosphate phosphatase Spo0E family protein [Bacillus kexueae]|uniref:aspartyl-phosphate phosphatase Spo0E family protein n=1 Tax=Aeribacillus kexueae TaxID=2078952 RepID=UPI001FAE8FFD|nr:aspartyl-phosphate phosphatase Spo0E family protein [Bacillus kexueae]
MSINRIETLRLKLIETAEKYGMNSVKTIQCSQELDTLLIEEMRLKREAMKKQENLRK